MKREVRLRSHSDFLRVQKTGKPLSHPLFVLRVTPNSEGKTRIGISVSKKVGNAVTRNKIRRRVRAILDSCDFEKMPPLDMVFQCRIGSATATFDEMATGVNELLLRAGYPNRLDD